MSDDELANLQKAWAITSKQYRAKSGAKHFWGEACADSGAGDRAAHAGSQRRLGRVSGTGHENGLPSKAGFKVTMRLVPDQDPDVIAELFTHYVLGFATDTVELR